MRRTIQNKVAPEGRRIRFGETLEQYLVEAANALQWTVGEYVRELVRQEKRHTEELERKLKLR